MKEELKERISVDIHGVFRERSVSTSSLSEAYMYSIFISIFFCVCRRSKHTYVV